MFSKKIPLSVWIGAGAVVVILLGWSFNVWQVTGVKDSFPYLEISRPLPELHRIEPTSAIAGETVDLFGTRFDAFDPRSSRIVIGSAPAEVTNWHRKPGRITVRIPQQLIPGQYPVSVQIGERQSAADVHLEVRLLPQDLAQQVANGKRVLALVAQFDNSQSPGALQTELVERMSHRLSLDKKIAKHLVIALWPEAVTGNVPERLRQISESSNARLIVFGRAGAGENFFPRIYAAPPAKDMFRPVAQQLMPASLTQLSTTSLDTYELMPQPIREPLRMIRFLFALGRYQAADYEGARGVLKELIEEKDVTVVDKGTLSLALGRVTERMGAAILEKPFRTEDDQRAGDALLQEAIDHLRRAAEELSEAPERHYQVAQVYLALGAASAQMPFRDLVEKHAQAVKYQEKALEYLDCSNEFLQCLIAYGNMSSSYEWLASTHWDRGEADDLLEKSIALAKKALEMHAARTREIETLPEKERTAPNLLAFAHAWLRNQMSITKGHLYRDRDRNLREAVKLAEEALPVFLARGDAMAGRIALTYNHIGTSLRDQDGDRAVLLQQAKDAFDKGLAYVGPQKFPEFHGMLTDNKKMVERLIAEGNKMREGEIAARHEATFERLYRAGQLSEAGTQALVYLNWSWRELRKPSPYTAIAHALLARIAQQAGDPTIASAHTISALTILSRFQIQFPARSRLVQDLNRSLYELLRVNRYRRVDIVQLVNRVSQGYQYVQQHRRAGDRLLESHPQKAIWHYTAALALYPYHPLILAHRANARLRVGDLDGCERDLSSALQLYPDDPIARYSRAQLHADAKRWQEALDDVNVAIGAGGAATDFFVLRAEVYENLGETAKALADYRSIRQRAQTDEQKAAFARRITELEKGSKADTK